MIRIERSTKPRAPFKCTDSEIKERIHDDFLHLCYVCEEYVATSYEIDHFFPKGQVEFKHLEHDWDNLFCICPKCNQQRPKDINTKGKEVLDSCKDDVETRLRLRFVGQRVEVLATDPGDEKAKNTKNLLDRIYNGIGATPGTRAHLDRREAIQKIIKKFEEQVEKFKKNDVFKSEVVERLAKDSRSDYSSFVTFKRQWIRDHHPELAELIPD